VATRKHIVESLVKGMIVRAEFTQEAIDNLKRLDMVKFKGTQGLGKYQIYRYVHKADY
jgi:hypothetical protein